VACRFFFTLIFALLAASEHSFHHEAGGIIIAMFHEKGSLRESSSLSKIMTHYQ
jgi:hypothetical protein